MCSEGNCSAITHKECLQAWQMESNDCPNCGKEQPNQKGLSRVEQKCLEHIKVKGCPAEGCQKGKMTLEQLISHLKYECSGVVIKCPKEECKE